MKGEQGEGQTKDFNRLRILYSVSKKLSVFSRMDESFADILETVSECFPLTTAILIEHWEHKPRMTIWFAANTPKETIENAIVHAKSAYAFIAGGPLAPNSDLSTTTVPESELHHDHRTLAFDKSLGGRFITLPLIIDYLPPLGALQLEGTGPLDEKDLDFASALTNLVTIAFDRYYKAKKEREKQEDEARKNLNKLYHSQDKILSLESERDLREAFVSLLIHDLITPLSIILGSAQMIIRRPDDLASHRKSAGMILAQANRAGQMITDLLDANRIQGGEKLSLMKEKTDIKQLVEATLTELSIMHGNRFILRAQDHAEADVDPRGIRRVIENLCNNAIKYGLADASVIVDVMITASELVISVTNRGNVISENDIKSLFHQFRRSDSASSGKQKGWGIGLTLVRGVAEAHGGQVTVRSDSRNGTIFTVTLPC